MQDAAFANFLWPVLLHTFQHNSVKQIQVIWRLCHSCRDACGFLVAPLLWSTLFLNVLPVISSLLWLYLFDSCMDRKGISKWMTNKTNCSGHFLFVFPQACAPLYHWRTVKISGEKDPVGTCYVAVQNFSAYAEYSPCRTSESPCSLPANVSINLLFLSSPSPLLSAPPIKINTK